MKESRFLTFQNRVSTQCTTRMFSCLAKSLPEKTGLQAAGALLFQKHWRSSAALLLCNKSTISLFRSAWEIQPTQKPGQLVAIQLGDWNSHQVLAFL